MDKRKKLLTGSQIAAARRRAEKARKSRRQYGKAARERDAPPPTATAAQLDLVAELAARHGLRLPLDYRGNYPFVKQFIEAIGFDPASNNLTGTRRINAIKFGTIDGQYPEYLAEKLEMPVQQVEFIIEQLKISGHSLEPIEEDLTIDPEDCQYQENIRHYG